MAFPAAVIAGFSGRLAFLMISILFNGISSLSSTLVWTQIQAGLLGLVLRFLLVPLLVMALSFIINKEKKNDE